MNKQYSDTFGFNLDDPRDKDLHETVTELIDQGLVEVKYSHAKNAWVFTMTAMGHLVWEGEK